MAEIIVENQVCEACGTEVRPQAQFCYHCGGPVAFEVSENNHHTNNLEALTDSNEAEQNSGGIASGQTKEKNKNDPKLKSAASLRNRVRQMEPQKIEIIWEEHENAPNGWFIGVTLILVGLAVLILFLAMYLK